MLATSAAFSIIAVAIVPRVFPSGVEDEVNYAIGDPLDRLLKRIAILPIELCHDLFRRFVPEPTRPPRRSTILYRRLSERAFNDIREQDSLPGCPPEGWKARLDANSVRTSQLCVRAQLEEPRPMHAHIGRAHTRVGRCLPPQ